MNATAPATLFLSALLLSVSWAATASAQDHSDSDSQQADGSWLETLLAKREAAGVRQDETSKQVPLPDFGRDRYTFSAWIKTEDDGSVFAKTTPEGRWVTGGKSLFIAHGRLAFDIGWVGVIDGSRRVDDGRWHHVAFTGGSPQRIYVDGRLDAEGDLEPTPDVPGHVLKLGYTSTDFPEQRQIAFVGEMDDVRIYGRALALEANPLIDFDQLVFIKRYTYHSSHFYTDFIDGVGNLGGNLCILDMKSGEVTELLPHTKEGIFGRFDLSLDAKRIVFDW
jgi:hypothetical protein